MIHRELHLDAVDALDPPEGEAAGVVDQHVEPCLAAADVVRQGADRGLRGEVGHLEAYVRSGAPP